MKKYGLLIIILSYAVLPQLHAHYLVAKGLGAAGDFVFNTASSGSPCILNSAGGGFPFVVRDSIVPCEPAVMTLANGALTLQPSSTYHITNASLTNMYTNNGCTLPLTNINPKITQLNCNGTEIHPNTGWTGSCSSTTCTASSGAITITLP